MKYERKYNFFNRIREIDLYNLILVFEKCSISIKGCNMCYAKLLLRFRMACMAFDGKFE